MIDVVYPVAAADAEERAVYRQSLAIMRIGQCREENVAGSEATPNGLALHLCCTANRREHCLTRRHL